MCVSHGAFFICPQCELSHVMPHVVACAVNTNDIMHASHMHSLVSQPSLGNHDAPENTCMPDICMS